MRKLDESDNCPIDLANESINNNTPFSFELALSRGMIVEVTDWVGPEIGFGIYFSRTRVALTARVWQTLLHVYVREVNGRNEQQLQAKRNDILWLAAQALGSANRLESAEFTMYLPLGKGVERCRTLRVECRDDQQRECTDIVIGFPADFARW